MCPGGCKGTVNTTTIRPFERVLSPERLIANEDCNYTVELLIGWKIKLELILNEGKQDLINITAPKIRSYLGYIKSATDYKKSLFLFSLFSTNSTSYTKNRCAYII